MALPLPTIHTQALEFISQRCFHLCFTLPATADHAALSVSYADVGADAGEHVPTVLFICGMFATRYLGVYIHHLAAKMGIRVIFIDRPGLGGSTPVPLNMRVPVWLEIVPAILKHLSLTNVVLASHSAGTIYLLNSLLQFRSILPPRRPYVALLGPWIDPLHSGVLMMQIAGMMPSQTFKCWNWANGLFMRKGTPALKASGMVLDGIKGVIWNIGSKQNIPTREREDRTQEVYGIGQELKRVVDEYVMQFAFEEETTGASEEALLCLRKGPKGLWGKCEDYAEFVIEMAEAESKRETTGEKLKVQAFFAEKDAMTGERGRAYFEDCWEKQRLGDALVFEPITVEGTTHDSLCDPMTGVWERIFVEAKMSFGGEDSPFEPGRTDA